jgi:competence protein ComGC
MDIMNKDENGFSAIESLLVILVIAVITFGGYYVWNSQKNKAFIQSSTTTSLVNKPATTTSTNQLSPVNSLSLMNGKVTYVLPDNLSTTKDGYAKTNHACGQTVYGSAECLDYITLYPKTEQFTNPDQFHITVAVFSSNKLTNVTAWYNDFLGNYSINNTFTNLNINGLSAIGYYGDINHATPTATTTSADIAYAVLSNNYGVLITSTLYNGNYYSVKNINNVDYFQYKSTIDTLAKSIKILN